MQEIIGKPKSILDTPCLVLDKKLLQVNIETMQHEAKLANKNVRPHAKTHKCTNICRQQIAAGANQLKTAGFACEILSGSGTGTYEIDMQISEVTEIQPGSYTVMDAEYFAIGQSANIKHNIKFKSALTLLTTVISANHNTHVMCDAGWKALYEVPTKPLILNPKGYLYDWGSFGDEHGKITALNNNKLPQLVDRLELIVAHCDPTINMYDHFYITENDIVVDAWSIDMRGKSQ